MADGDGRSLLLPNGSLFLGFDCSTQSLKATVLADLAIVAHDAVHFDSELPHYGTEGGVRRDPAEPGRIVSPPLMWAEALDLLLQRLEPRVDYGRVAAVSGSAQQHGSVYWRPGPGPGPGASARRRARLAGVARVDGQQHDGAMPGGRGRAGRRAGAGRHDGVPGAREVHRPADKEDVPDQAGCLRRHREDLARQLHHGVAAHRRLRPASTRLMVRG